MAKIKLNPKPKQFHYIIRRAKNVWVRYYMPLTDKQFDKIFNELRYELPRGWKVVHIDTAEMTQDNKRYNKLMGLPVVMSHGLIASTFVELYDAMDVDEPIVFEGFDF